MQKRFIQYLAFCLSCRLIPIQCFQQVAPLHIARQGLQRRSTLSKTEIVVQSSAQHHPNRCIRSYSSSSCRLSSTSSPLSELKHTESSSTSAVLSSVLQVSAQLSPLEGWCARELEAYYERAISLKCPFMKRRMVDALDAADMVLRFLVIRHKSLDIFGPPPGHRSKFLTVDDKLRYLTTHEMLHVIKEDWKPKTAKGYYITGNLNATIYRDDCLFDGPDPDMPVRGLRKYVNAASQLFDRSKSQAELLSLQVVEEGENNNIIVARWRMNGVLRLPWKPNLPEWTGSTTYHLDQDHLIYLHEETWDMSVWQAFMKTFAPTLSEKIWVTKVEEACS